MMLKMARYWVGKKTPLILMLVFSLLGTIGILMLSGWWAIASAAFMSFTAGVLLIMMVALPPLLVSASETGRLSAGNFLVGYTMAFTVPMLGGLLADWTGDITHAIAVMIAYGVIVSPLAINLDLQRQ